MVKRKKGPRDVKGGQISSSAPPADFNQGLAALLGSQLSVDDFQKVYFEQKPLHIDRSLVGHSESYYAAFADLATPESLFSLMDAGTVPVYRVNMFRCVDGSKKQTPNPPPATSRDVRKLFAEGWSIQWLQPQQEHDALAAFTNVLESEFGSLVGINAYLTPPGVQGLAPHWDDVEVFVLQLGGCKSWKLHQSTTASPLPPEAQTLPRYSSGDLDISTLSPMMMNAKLMPGDLLYLPRGIIHHAPNQNAKKSSVHLTISSFQRQTLFDLTQKTFEEAMSELWEEDENMRKALPWRSLSPGSLAHTQLRSDVAKQLRLLADAVEAEAGSNGNAGPISSALEELGADFVRYRMPPISNGVESMSLASPTSYVSVVDSSALALLPLANADDGSATLVHCASNSRRDHMMKHPETEQQNIPNGDAEDDDGEGDSEEEDTNEDAEEEDINEDAEDDDGEGDVSNRGQPISGHAAAVVRYLCVATPGRLETLEAVMKKLGVPTNASTEVCALMTQLGALGLVKVEELGDRGPSNDDRGAGGGGRKQKKKRKLHSG